MFRILVVDDNKKLVGDLEKLIESKLPATTVETAESVEEALRLISDDLTIAVLDIRLPLRAGMHPKAHMDVADRLRECNVPSICITGYAGTEDVEEYLRNRQLTGPPEEVISKELGPQFHRKLLSSVGRYLEAHTSTDIVKKLKGLFDADVSSKGVNCGTGPLLSLQEEITEYWPYLNDEARREVAKWFGVSEEDGYVSELTLRFSE